jgi:pyocin activator protein PrtN
MNSTTRKESATSPGMKPSTAFLLMAQFGGAAVIPLELVRENYFAHLTKDKFLRQILAGQICLPVVRMTDSKKTARGVHLVDLAEFIDKARDAALKECAQLHSGED